VSDEGKRFYTELVSLINKHNEDVLPVEIIGSLETAKFQVIECVDIKEGTA
jgi:hypothetical protein